MRIALKTHKRLLFGLSLVLIILMEEDPKWQFCN
jgi:hypothetical protein